MTDDGTQDPNDPQKANDKVLGTKLGFILLIAVVVFYSVPFSMADPDIWWHMRDAQVQFATHSFLVHDQFSFTAVGATWINHEWLAELPFYVAYRHLGSTGLYIVTLLSIEAIFAGLFVLATLEGAAPGAAALATILGVLLSTVSFGPRTLLFGWLLLISELFVLKLSTRREWLLWFLPVIFLLWVNIHGSWLIGMIVFGLFIASTSVDLSAGSIRNAASPLLRRKKLVVSWLSSGAALFVNPYGWHLVLYPFDLAFRQKLNVANVEEWKSLDFHTPRGRILLICMMILFLSQVMKSRRWSVFELSVGALGIYMAFSYSRFLFLLAILVVPSLAQSLTRWKCSTRYEFSPLLKAALILLLLCFIAARWKTRMTDGDQSAHRFPSETSTFLADFHPEGRVFNEFLWGGFLIWHQRSIPVFIDSRVDIFEYNGTFKDYLDIVRLKNSQSLLDRYDIRYVLYERDAPLTYFLEATHLWKVDYQDETVVILERTHEERAMRP